MSNMLLDEIEDRVTEKSVCEFIPIRFSIDPLKKRVICFEHNNKSFVVYDDFNDSVDLGGISGGYPRFKNGELLILGWFLPSYVYNEIEVMVDGHHVGLAKRKIRRDDVFNNFPQYGDRLSGFEYKGKINIKPKEVSVICRKNGKVVKIIDTQKIL